MLVFALLLVGCSAPRECAVDLLEVPATSRVALGNIVVGTPDGQQCLRGGLGSKPGSLQPAPDGLASQDSRAEILFAMLLPGEVTVEGQVDYTGPKVRVASFCNGEPIGDFELSAGNPNFQLDLPERALKPGPNILSLDIPKEALPLARWRTFSFTPRADQARVEHEHLVLPAGSTSDFYFRAPSGGELEAAAHLPSPSTSLRLELATEGSDSITKHQIRQSGHFRWKFPEKVAGRLCRLTLLGGSEGEITLEAPRVLGAIAKGTTLAPNDDPPPPLIVLICVDTLRSDSAGGAHSGTPLLDKRGWASFPRAIAQSSWTKTSIASVFTGREVSRHGVLMFKDKLSEDLVTLAETLRAGGYQTVGISANGWISQDLGYGQGFEQFHRVPAQAQAGVDRAIEALRTLDRQKPLFLYLHLLDPHEPYEPPQPFRPTGTQIADGGRATMDKVRAQLFQGRDVSSELRDLKAFYHGEIRYADQELERLLVYLESEGLYDPSLLVFFGDHGEQFGEHQETWHANCLYQCLLSVPLRWKLPAGSRANLPLDAMVQQVDIMPTLLAFARCIPLAQMDGLDLTTAAPTTLRERTAIGFLELGSDAAVVGQKPWTKRYESAIADGFKLHLRSCDSTHPDRPPWEFFDLDSDPDEQKDIASQAGPEVGYLWSRLVAARAGRVVAPGAQDSSTREAFQALPYLH